MFPSCWPPYLVSSSSDVGAHRHLPYRHTHPQPMTSVPGEAPVNLSETSMSSNGWTPCAASLDASSSPEKNVDVMGDEGKEERTRSPRFGTPRMTFSIDSILGLQKDLPDNPASAHGAECASGEDRNVDVVDDNTSHGDDQDAGGDEAVRTKTADGDNSGGERSNGGGTYQWLQCTRYHPPKLQRSKKKEGGCKKRKFGRNPRVPFTQHQVAVLEERFRRTHYLSSMDVAELSSSLTLSETRVKIWFQNRRARERREREASQRAHLLSQSTYQPLSIPSVTWALSPQLQQPSFSPQFRNEMNFPAGLFSSAFSAFSAPLQIGVAPEPNPASCAWGDCGNGEECM